MSYLLLEGTGKLLLEGTGGLLLEVGAGGSALVAVRTETVNIAETKVSGLTPSSIIVTRGPLLRFDILDTWGGNGGTILGVLFPDEMGAATIARGVAGDVRLTVEMPQNPDGDWAVVETGVVLRAIREASDGSRSWEEFLVQEIGDTQRTGVSSVTAVGFLGALVEVGVIEQVDADGSAFSDFDAPGLTPTQHLTTYIVGTATTLGLTCVGVGRVEYDTPLPNFAYAGDTPHAALQKLAQAVGGAEYRERWDEVTGKYLIDLVAQVGDISTTASPDDLGPFGEARAHVNAEIDRVRTRLTQANVIYPVGADGAKPGGAEWIITAKAGNVITLADPDGGDGPLALANQFVTGALKAQDGTLSAISAVNHLTQEITVASGAAFVVGEMAVICSTAAGRAVSSLIDPANVTASQRVSDVLSRPDIPGTVNMIPNPVGRAWPGAASVPPTGWNVVGSATITRTTTPGFIQDGPYSIKVETTGDGNGIATPLAILLPTALKPYGSGYFNLYLAAGSARVELVLSDGVTSWVVPNGVSQKALVTQSGAFTQLGIRGVDLFAAGATSARLRVVQEGTVNTTLYVSAAQLTATAAFEAFFEGNGPRKLHQAGNVAVLLRGARQVRYTMTLFDVARMLTADSAQLRVVLVARVRISNDTLSIADAVRIVQMVEDLKVEAQTSVVLSDRPEDMASLLLNTAPNARSGSAPTDGVVAVPGTARYVDDGVITSAGTGFNSATGLFTAADVGLTIWVFGGTAGQTILKTTIASVTDGDTLVMATAAGRTATGLTAIIGSAAEVLTLAGGIGGTRAGNALVDNDGKLIPGASDTNNRDLSDFFSKVGDNLDAVTDGSTYVKRLPLCTLTVTQPSATATTVDFQVTVGGGETIGWSSLTGVTDNGGGSYTVARPAAGAGPLLYTISSTRTNYETVSRVVSVPEQASSGQIYNQCDAKVTSVTASTVTVTVTATVASGTPQVKLVAITGSATLNSGAAIGTLVANGSAWTFDRGAFATGVGQVQFRAETTGAIDDDDFVDIAEVGRDTVALACRARVTASDATTITVRFAVADPYPQGAASVAVAYQNQGTGGVTPASPGTVTPAATLTEAAGTYIDYTITRPASGAGVGRVTFTATNANRLSDSDAVDVPEQAPAAGAAGPSLIVTMTPGATNYTITWSGTGTLTVSIDGGAYAAPAASPITVARNAVGGANKTYDFKAVGADTSTITNSVTIPAKGAVDSPDLSVVPGTHTGSTMVFTVSATNPSGGTAPTRSVTLKGTTGSGSVAGAIADNMPTTLANNEVVTVNRPAFNAVPAVATFSATISGQGTETIQHTILNEDKTTFGPSLTVYAAPGNPDYTITWSGSGTIEVSIDGGAYAAPSASPITVTRNAVGGADKVYAFRAVADGQTMAAIVLVPAIGSTGGGTVPPSIDAFYSTGVDTAADEVDLEWTVSNPPSSPTYDIRWRLQMTDPSTGAVTDEETGTEVGVSTPLGFGAAYSGSLDVVTKGTSGWHYAELWCNLRMKNSGGTVVATADTTVYFYGIYTP